MARPKTEAVATARCTGTEHIVSTGTESVPPPIPMSAETKPIGPAVAARVRRPCGGPSARTRVFGIARFTDTISATTPKITVSPSAPSHLDATPPSAAPTTIAGVQPRSRAPSMAPRRRCARADAIEVGTIVASEVPTTSNIATSRGTSKISATTTRTGTTTMPPPTPSRPASSPAMAPVTRRPSVRPRSVAMVKPAMGRLC